MHGGEKDGHSLPYYPQGRKPKQKTFTGKHVARLCASIFQPGPAIHVDGMSGWWRDVLGESSRTVVGLSNGREVNWPLTREPANGNPRGHWPLDPPPRVRLYVTILFKSHISYISMRFKTILYQNLILCAEVAILISDFVGHLAILWNAQFLCPSSILVL